MKRIDFFGAPGTGKTTIYNELFKRRTKRDKWMTPEEAKGLIAKQYCKQEMKSLRDTILTAVFYMPGLKKIKFVISNSILSSSSHEILLQNNERHHDFFSAVLNGAAAAEREPAHRLLGLNRFFSVCRNVLLIENSPLQRHVLFDESLVQKVYGITNPQKGFFEKATEDYFKKIPLPAGLIYCKLDPETTYHRIKQRPKIITGHRDMDEKDLKDIIGAQIEIASIGVSVLRNRGVQVLELYTGTTLAQSVKTVYNFIRV